MMVNQKRLIWATLWIIKALSSITIVQDAATALNPELPQAAITANLADKVMSYT